MLSFMSINGNANQTVTQAKRAKKKKKTQMLSVFGKVANDVCTTYVAISNCVIEK